jgi:hypothetical protein
MAVTKETEKFREHRANMAEQSWYDVDSQLNILLDLVFGEDDSNQAGRLGLTVVSQGTVITGTLVSQEVWKEALAGLFDEANPDSAEYLRKEAAGFQKFRQELSEEPGELPAQRSYIHFENASVWSGHASIKMNTVRVALRHVSAWSTATAAKA